MTETSAKISHRPSTETNALEMFEVTCEAEFWFYGPLGAECYVRREEDDGIAVECSPKDRPAVLKALKDLVALMEKAEKT